MARIHRAARSGKIEEVIACLGEGAHVNAFSIRGFTPLMIAAQEGHRDVVGLLLKSDAAPNLAHTNGRTALHLAADQGHKNIARMLLDAGADPNRVSDVGSTPMIEAIMFCHAEVVAILREFGADPTIRDRQGFTADEWLEQGGVLGQTQKLFPDHFPDSDNPAERPFAKQDTEEFLRTLMAEGLPAEEFAAKHGRNTLVWSYGAYRYREPEMETWVYRVTEIIFSPDLLAECEEKHLVGAELEEARKCRERTARSRSRLEQRKARRRQVD